MIISFVNRFDGSTHYVRTVSASIPLWYLQTLANKSRMDIVIGEVG